MDENRITFTVFGQDVDYRCPGWTFWQKFLVWLGLARDAYGNNSPKEVSTKFKVIKPKKFREKTLL